MGMIPSYTFNFNSWHCSFLRLLFARNRDEKNTNPLPYPPKKSLLAINWVNWKKVVAFLGLLLAINRDVYELKSTKANFASGKSRWLKKAVTFLPLLLAVNRDDWKRAVTFLRLLLAINWDDCSFLLFLQAINRDDCTFLRLLLAINRDDYSYFFEHLTPDSNCGNLVENQRKLYYWYM